MKHEKYFGNPVKYGKCIVQEWGTIEVSWKNDYPTLPFYTKDGYHYWQDHLFDEKYYNCRRCGDNKACLDGREGIVGTPDGPKPLTRHVCPCLKCRDWRSIFRAPIFLGTKS